MGRWWTWVGVALAAALWSAALADEPREILVTAQLLASLPADAAIAVEPRDDSDENLALRDLMVTRLAERHSRVAADAPLLLRFSSSVLTNRDTAPTGPTGGRGRGGRHGGGGIPLVAGTSSGGSSPSGARPSGGVRHRVTAALERRDGGQVLWKAEVTTAPGEHDERTLPGRLATALVEALGRTVDTPRSADGTAPAAPR
jgi:hypothetical protein